MTGRTGVRARAAAISPTLLAATALPEVAALTVGLLTPASRARSAADQPRRAISSRSRPGWITTPMTLTCMRPPNFVTVLIAAPLAAPQAAITFFWSITDRPGRPATVSSALSLWLGHLRRRFLHITRVDSGWLTWLFTRLAPRLIECPLDTLWYRTPPAQRQYIMRLGCGTRRGARRVCLS